MQNKMRFKNELVAHLLLLVYFVIQTNLALANLGSGKESVFADLIILFFGGIAIIASLGLECAMNSLNALAEFKAIVLILCLNAVNLIIIGHNNEIALKMLLFSLFPTLLYYIYCRNKEGRKIEEKKAIMYVFITVFVSFFIGLYISNKDRWKEWSEFRSAVKKIKENDDKYKEIWRIGDDDLSDFSILETKEKIYYNEEWGKAYKAIKEPLFGFGVNFSGFRCHDTDEATMWRVGKAKLKGGTGYIIKVEDESKFGTRYEMFIVRDDMKEWDFLMLDGLCCDFYNTDNKSDTIRSVIQKDGCVDWRKYGDKWISSWIIDMEKPCSLMERDFIKRK